MKPGLAFYGWLGALRLERTTERKPANPAVPIPTHQLPAEEVCEGLDAAVQKMKKGEKAIITVSPAYGFGTVAEHRGRLAAVAPGSTVQYEVELVDFENAKESWEMNEAEKVGGGCSRYRTSAV